MSVSVVWTRTPQRHDAVRLVRGEVSRLCGVDLESVRLTRLCPRCGSGEHGARSVVPWSTSPPPTVSLSRSTRLTAVVVATGGAVGIDVEKIDSFDDSRLSAVVLHELELGDAPVDLATTWVRKEALLKAAGCGLTMDPRAVRVSGPREAPAVLGWPSEKVAAKPTWLRDLDLVPEVRAALAGAGRVPDVVTVQEVGAAAPLG